MPYDSPDVKRKMLAQALTSKPNPGPMAGGEGGAETEAKCEACGERCPYCSGEMERPGEERAEEMAEAGGRA